MPQVPSECNTTPENTASRHTVFSFSKRDRHIRHAAVISGIHPKNLRYGKTVICSITHTSTATHAAAVRNTVFVLFFPCIYYPLSIFLFKSRYYHYVFRLRQISKRTHNGVFCAEIVIEFHAFNSTDKHTGRIY